MPFEVKADMKLAPNVRRVLDDNEKSKLDDLVTKGDVNISNLYISEIKSKSYTKRKSSRTWPLEANDDVVILGKYMIFFLTELYVLIINNIYLFFSQKMRTKKVPMLFKPVIP